MRTRDSEPKAVEVHLPQPIPIIRGGVVGVHIASSDIRDGHYIVNSGRENDRLCQVLSADADYMRNCDANMTHHILLIQPLVCKPAL